MFFQAKKRAGSHADTQHSEEGGSGSPATDVQQFLETWQPQSTQDRRANDPQRTFQPRFTWGRSITQKLMREFPSGPGKIYPITERQFLSFRFGTACPKI